jgi:hypothetical protein
MHARKIKMQKNNREMDKLGKIKEQNMQLLLPIFPNETHLITASLGVFRLDGMVFYLHCGVPIFTHSEEDIDSFRYITSNLILRGLCRKIEICKVFGVSYDSVNRYVNKLKKNGDKSFFTDETRHGHAYKLLPSVLEKAQKAIDAGKSNCSVARELNVSEGALRYALKTGKLKKKQ